MTIDNNTDLAAFAGRLEHLDMLSLAPTHNRSQKLKPRPSGSSMISSAI